MEAYKVLSKNSSRTAYDAEISTSHNPYYAYHSPYGGPSSRGAHPNESWQHMQDMYGRGYYRYGNNPYSK